MISVEESFDTTPTIVLAMLWHVHSILNIIRYTLTALELISEKDATFTRQGKIIHISD